MTNIVGEGDFFSNFGHRKWCRSFRMLLHQSLVAYWERNWFSPVPTCNYLIENYWGLKETNARTITTGRPCKIMKEVSSWLKANIAIMLQGRPEGVNLSPDGGPKSQGWLHANFCFQLKRSSFYDFIWPPCSNRSSISFFQSSVIFYKVITSLHFEINYA